MRPKAQTTKYKETFFFFVKSTKKLNPKSHKLRRNKRVKQRIKNQTFHRSFQLYLSTTVIIIPQKPYYQSPSIRGGPRK